VPQFETVHMHKDQTLIPVTITMSPVREISGRIIGASTVAQDNSSRKQDEDEKLGLIRDLSQALSRTRTQASQTAPP